MQFIINDQRIAVENFEIGLIYTVTFTDGRYFSGACIGKGADFVMFQRTFPELVYCLNMAAAADVESIEQTGGGSGTLNYNDLYNKPQINGVELAGNKSSSELGLADITGVFGPGTEIIGTSEEHQDLDDYTGLGVYFCRNSTNAGYVDNKPVGGSGFRLIVENISGTNTFRQTFIKPTDPSRVYIRHFSASAWSTWYIYTGQILE